MQQAHRKVIKRNLVNLSKDLDFQALLPHISQSDIFPDGKLDTFENIQQNRNVKFLTDIQTRGPTAFEVLVKSLRSTKQGHVADLIDPDQMFVPLEEPSSSGSADSAPHLPQRETRVHHAKLDEVDAAPWTKTDECYRMQKNPRGIILIINNETFLDEATLPAREGTNQDCERVEDLFADKLGFLVVKKQNLKLEEMKQLYKEFQKKDYSTFDCFVSVILSHGLHDGVCAVDYDKDQHEVLSIEEVVAGMDECESLAGKPKVFFTQACRGEKVHKPRAIQTDARRPPEDIARDKIEQMRLTEQLGLTEPAPVDQRTHVGSDVLIAYPSIKGYAAAREPDRGTWYIRSLCEVLEENANKEHLAEILTKVNQKVGENRGTVPDGSIVTQTSEYTTTLKKKLYFPPVTQTNAQQPTN